MKKRKKHARGTVLTEGASSIWTFVNSHFLREYDLHLLGRYLITQYDVDLLGLFCDFSQQPLSVVRSTAVSSAILRGDLLLQLSHIIHPHRSPSDRPVRGCVSYFLCAA